MSYRSPIILESEEALEIKQKIRTRGKNTGAQFISEDQIFLVRDKVKLKVNGTHYDLVEYHFHVSGEHEIDGKVYPSEIHYVFEDKSKLDPMKPRSGKIDVCGGNIPDDCGDLLVISQGIKPGKKIPDVTKLQVIVPEEYYMYDGSSPDPVKWLIDRDQLKADIEHLKPIAKTARPFQPLNGRIILISK